MRYDNNYTMLFDFYEMTMGNGYFQTGLQDRICYFDVFPLGARRRRICHCGGAGAGGALSAGSVL